jgi:alkylation response protein AidB-like acyl-CoA dehydrogenase
MANTTMTNLLLPGWVRRGSSNRRGHEYAELVRLRGATVTMLQTQRISVPEARRLRALLNVARLAVDAGRLSVADTELAAVRAYLKARQGEPV